jgi:hypothetical protein
VSERNGRARQHIADTAARLFAERGYEHVAVLDVAEAAEVSEQPEPQSKYGAATTTRGLLLPLPRAGIAHGTRTTTTEAASASRNAL